MGLFDFFRKKKTKLTEEQLRWNKMWELWVEGEAISPYAELMTYQGEINNGGHSQYFTNIENTGDLHEEMSALKSVLPPKMRENLQKAYTAYLISEGRESGENADEITEQCDNFFYENEAEINRTLEEYAAKIEL